MLLLPAPANRIGGDTGLLQALDRQPGIAAGADRSLPALAGKATAGPCARATRHPWPREGREDSVTSTSGMSTPAVPGPPAHVVRRLWPGPRRLHPIATLQGDRAAARPGIDRNPGEHVHTHPRALDAHQSDH
ncbi:hypothetical protein ACPA9J_07200 [Pseudomonas aeruginosa]